MIRVDANNRMDVIYAEIDEALGEEEGSFNAAEFEENMSTHYGRMIHEDDRTIMFANPEDAADYIGFDLKPTRSDSGPSDRTQPRHTNQRRKRCTRRMARSTSSSTATCTSGTPARRTG